MNTKRFAFFPKWVLCLLGISCFLGLFASCSSVSKYSDQALGFLGFGEKKSDSKTDGQKDKKATSGNLRKQGKLSGNSTETTETETDDQASKTTKSTPESDNTTSSDAKLIINRDQDDQSQKIRKTDLKKAIAPEFKVEAPVDVQKRIGGVARKIMADGSNVYLDFPQHFALHDSNFNLMATAPVSFPVKAVKQVTRQGKICLYLTEENHVLEIFELNTTEQEGKTRYTLSLLKSFEVDGDFFWINASQMALFLEDKLHFLDFNDLDNIKIVNETPIGGVTSALVIGKQLFLAKGDFLEVISLENFDRVSSLRVGSLFGFLGVVNQPASQLLLALTDDKKNLQAVQALNFNKDQTGISDFGPRIDLPSKLSDFLFDETGQLVVGREVTEDEVGPVRLFSIAHKAFLRGPLSTCTNLISWWFDHGILYMVNDVSITTNQIELNQKVIAQAPHVQKLLTNRPTNVPLAQIGADKIVKDEYNLNTVTKLEFMADARKVILLNEDHVVLVENTASPDTQKLFTSPNLSLPEFALSEQKTDKPQTYDRLLTTNFGVLAYSKATGNINLLDVDFKQMALLPITVTEMVSWAQFAIADKEYLAVSGISPTRAPKDPSYVVAFYELTSPTNAKLIADLPYEKRPFVFYVPESQIVVMNGQNMDLYPWQVLTGEAKPIPAETDTPDPNAASHETTTPQPQTTKKNQKSASAPPTTKPVIKPDETMTFTTKELNIEAAKINPAFDTIYALFREKNLYKIFVVNVFDTSLSTTMNDFDITPDHFEGTSFAKDGRLFILPSLEGTLFYDMTDLSSVHDVAHWPVPSYYVDIAGQGHFICVALGYKGVYCGKLLF